ncbi:MAG: ABC transporter substrate-binding protein [Abditibacteriota bacterium]|nr:ABC transporter substrate-binding protein [Abditibacteriota bacterium]
MKRLLLPIIAAALICGCGGIKEEPEKTDGATEITVWHPWGGTDKEKFDKLVAYYNRSQDKIRVKAVFVPNDTSTSQKFFTSVASGKVPDLSVVDGPQVVSWAAQGAIVPIDKYMKEAGLTREDFFGPCYDEMLYRGKVHALHFSADPNSLFGWNKKVFRESGLDPERPPKTIKELDEMDRKIRRIDPKNGTISRMGIIPWLARANTVFLWGYAYGGSFYDPKTHKVTADDPKIVAFFEWMRDMARVYDPEKITAFASGFGGYDQSPFYIGKLAMTTIGPATIEDIKRYAPNLDYGIAPWPAPEDGEYGAAWLGGWCFGLPKGCKHPDEAWEFLRWMTADPEGTKVMFEIFHYMPAYKKSKAYDEMTPENPYWPFYRVLLTSKHTRPIMPAQALYMGEINKAIDRVIYGVQSPKEAMEQVTSVVQKELDLKLAAEK